MERHERDQIIRVLGRIPREEWARFLRQDEGAALGERLDAARGALRECGAISRGAVARPNAEVVDLLGHRLLSSDAVGPWLRLRILERLAPSKWQDLSAAYRRFAGHRFDRLHGNMSQGRRGSRVMAAHWQRGSRWAAAFCEVAGLPGCLAIRERGHLPEDEEVVPAGALPPLHDFQVPVYASLRRLLRKGLGEAAMLSLPTGAGKTRVAIEALCDHLAEEPTGRVRRNYALWIAQSDELQQQAWECVRQVWQVPPQRHRNHPPIRRVGPLRIVRLWGGRRPEEIEWTEEPTIFVAGVDQLASWAKRCPEFFEGFPRRRLAGVFLDEAHFVLTKEYRRVLTALGLRHQHRWTTVSDAPPVIGLTATPWRTIDDEDHSLQRFFRSRLIGPEALGGAPVKALQARGILARVKPRKLLMRDTPPMTRKQRSSVAKFKELPGDYLEQLGWTAQRNAGVLRGLERLPKRSRVLVFGCSIAHAEVLSMVIDSYFGEDCAAVVTSRTARPERAAVVERFRNGDGIRFLCNVGVLATLDAPAVDAVCVTRPTMSAIRYEQMVGRGLRGPRNGGTEFCTVMDVQDNGLPEGIQSYGRVLQLWEGNGRRRKAEP